VTAISDEAIANAQKTDAPVLPGLVSIDDPDWVKFSTDDPEWFIRVAGTAVRKFCGWNVFPNIRQHLVDIPVGAHGIVMLPSLRITGVDRLALSFGREREHEVHRGDYEVHDGYLRLRQWGVWDYPGIYGNDQQWYAPGWNAGVASVTFWSGYHVIPDDVKEICFELAQSSMTLKVGNLKSLATPGEYKIELTQDAGLTLNCDQRNRLGPYRLQPIA
jgi:hypothetical protein